jgi:hypothetical protein
MRICGCVYNVNVFAKSWGESNNTYTTLRLFAWLITGAYGDSQFRAMFLILAILSRVSPVSAAGNGSFTPLLLANGSAMCATDQPSLVVTVASILGIPDGVPDAVRCGMVCKGYSGCSSFNYRQSSGGLCEMYTYTPQNCTTTDKSCMFYQVSVLMRITATVCFRAADWTRGGLRFSGS